MSDTETAQSTEAAASDQTLLGGAEGATETTAEAGAEGASEATSEKPAGEQGSDSQAETEGKDKPEGEGEGDKKPVEYADFALPEGMTVDQPILDEAKSLFAEDGLSQERAQKYVDLYTNKLKESAEAPYKLWAETQKQWQDSIRNDPEVGGSKLAENLGVAAKALDRFGGDKLRQALNFTGAGNHPDVIKAFVQIGKAISEGKFVTGGGNAGSGKSRAERLYPTDPLKPQSAGEAV